MTFISTLIAIATLAVNLTITPAFGTAPLKSNFKASITGPVNGLVCLELTAEKEVMGTAWCQPADVADGSTTVVEWNLNGTDPGNYSFRAVILTEGNEQPVAVSAPVAVVVK